MENINTKLDKISAKRIINDVGGTGQPPLYGYQFFSAGLEEYIKTIEEEYLDDYIKYGGSSFKLVVGAYGGGKTHFLYNIQGKSWDSNYITAYIELSPNSTPFHKLEQVYKSIVSNLLYPQDSETLIEGYDKGIEAAIKSWYGQKYIEFSETFPQDELEGEINDYVSNLGPYESTSFKNAMKNAFLAQHNENEETFNLIIQWLKGENPPKATLKDVQIFEKIDKTTAFKMLRCLIQWIWDINYSGLIVLMDEAEQTPSMTTKQRNTLLQNLRELIDACSRGGLKGTMVFYAVPDESFLEGRTAVYEALNQRLETIFEGEINPTGVKIDLENISSNPIDLLNEIGKKLARIYEIAYNMNFEEAVINDKIQEIAEKAYNEERFGEIGYKRNFVQQIIQSFHALKANSKK